MPQIQPDDIRHCIAPVFKAWSDKKRAINLKVEGNSMEPLIRPGSLVSLRFADPSLFTKGDIIAFQTDEHLVVHRLVKKKQLDGRPWICQKGDNLSGWGWVPEDRVKGRVESIKYDDSMRDLTRRPWALVNLTLGLAGWGLVTSFEMLRPLGSRFFRNREARALSVAGKIFVDVFNRICRVAVYLGQK
ncbi:MAG: S24 family peptidase [Thermodesulfobacteriota bacterium]|nr:S24 family peptidase [Thermodesulfobacteriota bacterium]